MEICQSVLLPFAAEDMFDLIEQAEHYPRFIPWCVAADILERSDDWVAARLEFSYLKQRFSFATRNPKQRPQWLQVRLIDGPFRDFLGTWTLTPIASLGCRVSFELRYELHDRLTSWVALPAAEVVARRMVDAFVNQAHAKLKVLEPAQCAPTPNEQASATSSGTPPQEEA